MKFYLKNIEGFFLTSNSSLERLLKAITFLIAENLLNSSLSPLNQYN